MVRITASEFQKSFGAVSDRALREPVAITKQGRDHLVVLSAEEFARLKRRDRQVHAVDELPDEVLDLIERTEMDPRHGRLDAELKSRQASSLPKPEAGLVIRYASGSKIIARGARKDRRIGRMRSS